MFWYALSLLFKSIHSPESDVEPLWEERIILVRADSEEVARKKAMEIGRKAEHAYSIRADKENADVLKWTFEQIERVYQIEDENIESGTEVFSRFLRESEVRSLLSPFDN